VSKAPEPRLHAILARAANTGVVFRRGPSRRFFVYQWNRDTDSFRRGSEFRGKLYPDRSDLSPDGQYLIYFAMAGLKWALDETKGTWTAISQPPSLSAIALWGQGDTWGGGGYFISNREYWLASTDDTFLIRDSSGLTRLKKKPQMTTPESSGWDFVSLEGSRRTPIWQKVLPGGWILRRRGWDSKYQLQSDHFDNAKAVKLRDSTWADWDRNRLVWVEKGKLLASHLLDGEWSSPKLLKDFCVEE
jgi:hypothetical protein